MYSTVHENLLFLLQYCWLRRRLFPIFCKISGVFFWGGGDVPPVTPHGDAPGSYNILTYTHIMSGFQKLLPLNNILHSSMFLHILLWKLKKFFNVFWTNTFRIGGRTWANSYLLFTMCHQSVPIAVHLKGMWLELLFI